MKIRIVAQPGELQQRAEAVVRVLEQMTGRCLHDQPEALKKADSFPDADPVPLLAELEARARRRQVDRLRQLMRQKMIQVIGEVPE